MCWPSGRWFSYVQTELADIADRNQRAGPDDPVLLAAAGLVLSSGFWWLTMRILLPGRIAGRDLIPSACATGMLYVAMEAVFSLVFSAMVISNEKKYGPHRDHLRPAVLPDCHRRRSHPGRGRGPRLARTLIRQDQRRAFTGAEGTRGGPDDRQHQCGAPRPVSGSGTGQLAAARLTSAATEIDKPAETLYEIIELAEMTGRSGRTGKTDLR